MYSKLEISNSTPFNLLCSFVLGTSVIDISLFEISLSGTYFLHFPTPISPSCKDCKGLKRFSLSTLCTKVKLFQQIKNVHKKKPKDSIRASIISHTTKVHSAFPQWQLANNFLSPSLTLCLLLNFVRGVVCALKLSRIKVHSCFHSHARQSFHGGQIIDESKK